MTYRIIYGETPMPQVPARWHREPAATEEFATEDQALGRARELIETGEHYGVTLDDGTGNVLYGVRLQLRLGGFARD